MDFSLKYAVIALAKIKVSYCLYIKDRFASLKSTLTFALCIISKI